MKVDNIAHLGTSVMMLDLHTCAQTSERASVRVRAP